MGIRGASILLSNGKKISVESSDDEFTGDLSVKDQKTLARELIREIRKKFDGPVELARGARIVMYESANSARWSPSFWSYLFRPSVTKYTEVYVDPSDEKNEAAIRMMESGAVLLYGSAPDSFVPERFFLEKLPQVLKNHAGDFASVRGIFRVEIGEGDGKETWFVQMPEGKSSKKPPTAVSDCTITLSESAARKALKGDFSPLSYVFDLPSLSGNQELAKQFGWLLKKYRSELI